MYIFAEDERVREELIRQKEFEADQRWLHTTLKEYEANQERMNKTIAEQNTLLNDKDRQIAELEAIIAEMKQKN